MVINKTVIQNIYWKYHMRGGHNGKTCLFYSGGGRFAGYQQKLCL